MAERAPPPTELAWCGARARGGCTGFGSGGVGGRGTGPRDGANFATCVVFLLFLTRTKRRKMAFFEGCPVGWGGVPEAGQGLGGGCKGFGSGGVGGRGTGPRDGANFATRVVFLLFLTRTKRRKMAFLKDALWGGGGTHRSWPGGRGGRPRALIPGCWLGRQRLNTQPRSWLGGRGVREAGQGLGGGARASVPGG